VKPLMPDLHNNLQVREKALPAADGGSSRTIDMSAHTVGVPNSVIECGPKPNKDHLFGGKALARNSVLNLVAQSMPLVIGLAAIPLMISRLGTVRFGLLSLAWIIYGNMSLFELGLGRATTKFVAEHMARADYEALAASVRTCVLLQLSLGTIAAGVIAACVPWFVQTVLHTPADVSSDARRTFFILAAMLPISLPTISLRGVLEALQRFDLVNAVKGPQNAAIFLFPVVALLCGAGLPLVALSLAASWVLAALAYFMLLLRVVPQVHWVRGINWAQARSLLSFGGWVTVSSIIGLFLAYLDRFYIGALLSLTAVAYYTVPYDAVTRLWVVPMAISTTLFPAFSSLGAMGASDRRNDIFRRSVKYLFAILGPLVLTIVLFAPNLLHLWLGSSFAIQSTLPLQILALGTLINSVSWVPYNLLQGIGRPDLTAKFHVLELVVYACVAWVLIARFGLVGAAVAWVLRVTADALLLFFRVSRMRLASLSGRDSLCLIGLIAYISACVPISHSAGLRPFAVAVLEIPMLLSVWQVLFSETERKWVREFVVAAWPTSRSIPG
jgi:O-antigen/teichoic acid export membrane protein